MPKKKKDTANRNENLKASAAFPNGWHSAKKVLGHNVDRIDLEVGSMAQSIKMMHRGGVPFSIETYKMLVANYKKCAELNGSLLPEQRALVINILMSKSTTVDLEQILLQATTK